MFLSLKKTQQKQQKENPIRQKNHPNKKTPQTVFF